MKNAAKAAVFVMYPVIFYWPDLVQLSRRYEGCDKVEHMCSGDFFFHSLYYVHNMKRKGWEHHQNAVFVYRQCIITIGKNFSAHV